MLYPDYPIRAAGWLVEKYADDGQLYPPEIAFEGEHCLSQIKNWIMFRYPDFVHGASDGVTTELFQHFMYCIYESIEAYRDMARPVLIVDLVKQIGGQK